MPTHTKTWFIYLVIIGVCYFLARLRYSRAG